MKLYTRIATTCVVAALAMIGCEKGSVTLDETGNGSAETGKIGKIAAQLTLPDDTEITSVAYTITGPAGFMPRTGNVPVGNSTVLTFRIGGLPVQGGYTLALSADTGFGNSCSSSTPFSIADNQTTLLNVVLLCTATDDGGDLIVNGGFESCPIITSITALPAEITLGNAISLESDISHGTNPVLWTGVGGTFGTPNDYDTTFTCTIAGPHTLTVAVDTQDCSDARTVDVVCTLGAGCGNGQLDAGEQCDDGNNVDTDACTNVCQNAICGDNIVLAGTESCDDGGTITEECAYGLASCQVCDSACQTVAGDVDVCGDGTTDVGESCDDSNTVTEACAYGQTSCSVCTSSCATGAGDAHFCGDGLIDAADGEQCDGGAACSATCQTLVDNCAPCRTANCTNYLGFINPVAGCFDMTATGDAARAAFGAVFTAAQVQACVDASSCAHVNHCGFTAGRAAAECYCGTAYPNNGDCANGAAGTQNGVCKAQFEAATEATAPSTVVANLASTDYPSGWVFYLLDCETTYCSAVCN